MSFSPEPGPARLSARLTEPKIRELAALILKSEHPSPSRAVIEPLLELLVGGPFSLRENFLIKEPGVFLLLLELLPGLPEAVQLELWSIVTVILHRSLWNIHTCRQLQLIERCLSHLTRAGSDQVANQVARVVEILGSHCLSVKELKAILSFLYAGQNKTWMLHSTALIGSLNNLTLSSQPDVFFHFSGQHGAAITLPPISKWPSHGFTLTTWVRFEKPYDSKRDYYKPVVYWFRTGKGIGYSSHMVGSTLVLETVGRAHKKPQTHAVNFIFQSYQWYMLTVVYTHHRLKSSELCCCVDGEPVLTTDVTLPSTEDVYDKCFLGSSPTATQDSVFQGQMSAVYLFKEPLTRDTITALHKLGASYKSQFRFDAESDVPLKEVEKKMLFDGRLASALVFSYNARAVDGQLCLEASPNENPSCFAHSPHATLLEGVEPVITTSFHSALHSMGGIQAFLPLFHQLDFPQTFPANSIDYTLSVKILSLVFETARNSTSSMLQLVQSKAIELISFLLEKSSPHHLSEELVSCIFDFCKYLSVATNGLDLLTQLLDVLLFNGQLWSRARERVQLHLYSQIAADFSNKPLGTSGLELRLCIGVSRLMFVLREYYSLSVEPATAEKNSKIRPYLLLIAKKFSTMDKGLQRDELESILGYLCAVPEEENLHDVLRLLLALVFEDPSGTAIKLFEELDGINVSTKLLACTSEDLTLDALKLIGKVLHHASSRHRRQLIESMGLLSVIREKLLSAGQPVSIAMFNTLFELLVDCPSRRIIESHYLALDLSHQIECPGMLAVMIELLCTLHTVLSDWDEHDLLMRQQLLSYVSSLCAQNRRNCKSLIQLRHWQHWLFVLADQPRVQQSDYESLQEMLLRMLQDVLLYCFQEEQDGWRVWVETAAILHAYVAIVSETGTPLLPSSNMEGLTASYSLAGELSYSMTSSLTEQFRRELASVGDDGSPLEAVPLQHSDSLEEKETAECDKITESSKEVDVKKSVESVTPSPLPRREKPGSISTLELTSLKHPPLSMIPAAPPSLSRSSSNDTPSSPFLIPRNPFLTMSGKMPSYQWLPSHIRLLEDLLKSLQKIVSKWRGSSSDRAKSSLSEHISSDSNRLLCSNTAHLLVLTVDDIVSMNGGLESLLMQSTSPGGTQEAAAGVDLARAQSLLRLATDLAWPIILDSHFKHSTIETRMKMETGGIHRQGLRLVLSVASLTCIEENTIHKELRDNYQREKEAAERLHQESVTLLNDLGVGEGTLNKYFYTSLGKRFEYLRSCQCLLSDDLTTLLHSVFPKEGDKQIHLQLVLSVVHYLVVTSVAKYRSILDAAGGKGEEGVSSLNGPGVATQLAVSQRAPEVGASSESESDSEKSLSCLPDVEQSLMPSTLVVSRAVDVSDQVEASLKLVGHFLCHLLVEHKSVLAKVLVTADGRKLLSDAVLRLAENKSIVEMAMLLCSQEWQATIQRTGGKVFSGILTEGRHMVKFCESYLRSVAIKSTADFKKTAESQTDKFTHFEEQLSLFVSECIRTTNEDFQLRRAEMKRHTVTAKESWRKVFTMVDEHGSFDFTPIRPSHFSKLDLRENRLRQRTKLLDNPQGSVHEEASRRSETEEHDGVEGEGVGLPRDRVAPPSLSESVGGSEEASLTSDELTESLVTIEPTSEQEQALQLLSLKCELVVLGRVFPGTLVFTKSSFTFAADDSSEGYAQMSFLSDYCCINGSWLLEEVRAVFSRRYLQQNKALEIFFADRTSALFCFASSKEVKVVVRRLPKVGVGPLYGLPQTRAMSLASPQQLFKKSTMISQWERREISNFEYLMFLNTISGRSYNDLNQYPVLPWILADYTSQSLDLSDPSVYRDLTQPIGALNPARLRQLEERLQMWEDDRIPPFLYGTHYSTMAFVLHWLVRVEPFSSLHIQIHDGLFDHGSRLFHSLQDSWTNSHEDTSDVKELIPEFFYLPEMFLNDNQFKFGRGGPCEEGDIVHNVVLPPWASSAREFVRIHREALESEFVSTHIHHWIDLIFGFKQRGEEAMKAKNVFYYLTYTGAVDLDSVTDPQMRKGLEDQMRHFGQTPSQLSREPHPARQPLLKGPPPQNIQGVNPVNKDVVAELCVTPDVPIALVQLSSTTDASLLVVSYSQLYAVSKWNVSSGSNSQAPIVTLDPDPNIDMGLKIRLGDPLDQSVSPSAACFTATPGNEAMLVCGFWDKSFKCFSADTGLLSQSVFGHQGVVTCIDFSPESGLGGSHGDGLIATGSHDVTVLVWKWSGRRARVVGVLAANSVAPVAVLTGHEQSIVCVALDASNSLVVSGAKSGCCLVHSTSGELLHKLIPASRWTHPHLVCIDGSGCFFVHYADKTGCLAAFTCNGKQTSQHSLREPALAMTLTSDGRYVVVGGFSCQVTVLLAHNLETMYSYQPFQSSVRSLHLSPDQRFIFAGLASGNFAALTTHRWMH